MNVNALLITDKLFSKYNGEYYTTGGSPAEYNYLEKKMKLTILAQVEVVSSKPENLGKINNSIRIFEMSYWPYFHAVPPLLNLIRTYFKAKHIIKKQSINVVYAKGPRELGLCGVFAANSLKVASICHYSYNWFVKLPPRFSNVILNKAFKFYLYLIHVYKLNFMKQVIKNATKVASVSNQFRVSLSQQFDVPMGNILLMPETFTSDNRFRNVKNIELDSSNQFIYVGRIDRNKNLKTLIEAVRILRDENNLVANVVVVGDGPALNDIRQLIKEYKLEQQFNLKGYLEHYDILRELGGAHTLILPSFSEAFPQVIIEAITAGRAVIASNVGGIPEIIDHGFNGFLFDPYSSSELAQRMKTLMVDHELRMKMGSNSRIKSEEFSPDRSLDAWLNGAIEAIDTNGKKFK